MKILSSSLLFLLLCNLLATEIGQIERRKNQYPNDQGYFIAPVPYALPGIGSGILVLGMVNNVKGTQTDLLFDAISGDVGGYGFGIGDWYIVDKHLKFELLHSKFDKASIQSYSTRGMKSKKDDYINVEVDAMEFTGTRATLSFYDKMVEFYAMAYLSSFNLKSLKDKDGNTILDASDSKTKHGKVYIGGLMLDYTDDRLDPRRGVRLDSSLDYSPRDGTEGANYFVSNYNLTGYLPIGKKSTWVFNYYHSDANVIAKGETDFETISEKMGIDCSLLTNIERKSECESVVFNTIAANKYGTASSLGGGSRLRSYSQGRYSGAHSQSYGTEFRWNITEETTPFDIWLMKDIRTNIQTAFFYERGSVAEKISDLGKIERSSYGAGIRMVTASGLVYRFDIANGDEDFEVTVIINYPWEQF